VTTLAHKHAAVTKSMSVDAIKALSKIWLCSLSSQRDHIQYVRQIIIIVIYIEPTISSIVSSNLKHNKSIS